MTMDAEALLARFPGADRENLEMALDLLRSFDRLVAVGFQGRELLLPERNPLWRGLQFWGLATGGLAIDFTRFCLAGNCRNCTMTIRRAAGRAEEVLACRTEPEAGMEILALPEGFRMG